MPHTTSPSLERSIVHAEGVLFAVARQKVYEWPSPVNLITSLNLNLRVSFIRFFSRSFPDRLLRFIHSPNQPSLTSYFQFVTLHVLSVLIHFRSTSLTYLILLLCCSQDGALPFPNSLSDRKQEEDIRHNQTLCTAEQSSPFVEFFMRNSAFSRAWVD